MNVRTLPVCKLQSQAIYACGVGLRSPRLTLAPLTLPLAAVKAALTAIALTRTRSAQLDDTQTRKGANSVTPIALENWPRQPCLAPKKHGTADKSRLGQANALLAPF